MVGRICQANSRLVSVGTGYSTANATSRNGMMAAESTRVGFNTRSCRVLGLGCAVRVPIRVRMTGGRYPLPTVNAPSSGLFLDGTADRTKVLAEAQRWTFR